MNISRSEKAIQGIAHLLFSRVASKAITFGFLIAFVRLLDREELALLPLYYAATGASLLLFSFGVPATLVREIPRLRVEDPEEMQRMLFTGFTFVFTGVIATSALALFYGTSIRDLLFEHIDSRLTYLLIIVGMIIGGWNILMRFILKSLQEYKDLAICIASYDLLHKFTGLTGYILYGIDGLLVGFISGGLLCNAWFTGKYSRQLFSSRRLLPLTGLIRLSWPFYIEGYLHYFRNNGDVILIGSLLGPQALALLYIAKRLYDLLMIIIRSIEDVVSPSLSQLLGMRFSTAVDGYLKINLLAPVVLIPMGFIASGLSFFFVDIVGGSEYAEQAYILTALFCIVAVIEGLYGIQGRAIFVLGRPTERLMLVTAQAAVYFPLLFLLVTKIGIIGAPIAQLISFIIGLVYANRIISNIIKYTQYNIIVWKIIIASSIGLSFFAALQIYYYSPYAVPAYLLSAIIIIVLISSILASDYDLKLIMDSLPTPLKGYFSSYMRIRSRILSSDNR